MNEEEKLQYVKPEVRPIRWDDLAKAAQERLQPSQEEKEKAGAERFIAALDQPDVRHTIVIRSDDAGKFRSENRDKMPGLAVIELEPRKFIDIARLRLGPTDVAIARGDWTMHDVEKLRDALKEASPAWGGLVLVSPDGSLAVESVPAEALRVLYVKLGALLRAQAPKLEVVPQQAAEGAIDESK